MVYFSIKKKTRLVKFPKNKHVPYYHIPDTVKAIGKKAFDGCEFVKKITQAKAKYVSGELHIPLLLRNIKCDAFTGCKNIRRLELLNYVHLQECFNDCNSLEIIRITKKNLILNNFSSYIEKEKYIINIENGFVYFGNNYVGNTINEDNWYHESKIKVYGLCNENVYFKKNYIIQFCNLKNYIECKVEFKFTYNPFSLFYLFSWLF